MTDLTDITVGEVWQWRLIRSIHKTNSGEVSVINHTTKIVTLIDGMGTKFEVHESYLIQKLLPPTV